MEQIEARLVKLETTLDERIGKLTESMQKMERSIEKMAEAMAMQAAHGEWIEVLRKRTHELGNHVQGIPHLREKVDRCEWRLDQIEPKVNDLDKRSTVTAVEVAAVIGVAGIVLGWIAHALGWM